jgi:hypothetical protein
LTQVVSTNIYTKGTSSGAPNLVETLKTPTPTPFRGLPAPFEAQRYMARARQFRRVAIPLVDMDGPEPNWPKYFLLTHAIELALKGFLIFCEDHGLPEPPGPPPGNHDLVGLYERAVAFGLERNSVVTGELPHIGDLHKIHYARYPQAITKPVALISQYDDMADRLFADVAKAISLGPKK